MASVHVVCHRKMVSANMFQPVQYYCRNICALVIKLTRASARTRARARAMARAMARTSGRLRARAMVSSRARAMVSSRARARAWECVYV